MTQVNFRYDFRQWRLRPILSKALNLLPGAGSANPKERGREAGFCFLWVEDFMERVGWNPQLGTFL